jgi:hypothetical protein
VIFVSVLVAPSVMAAATLIEGRRGPAAAGWAAALPLGFSVAVVAVTLDAGAGPASTMALSAAAHVPAQVGFALVFAGLLPRRGLLLAAAAATIAYAACSLALADLPQALLVTAALPALVLAPRFLPVGRPPSGAPRRWPATVIACAIPSAIVGAAVLTTRVAGPATAGAVAAFPTVSMAFAVAIVMRDGRSAGTHALAGLVRSLPCYLAFCLVIALTAPSFGVAATALGLLACVGAARMTYATLTIAAAKASTSDSGVSHAHIHRTSPVCSSHT